MTRLAKPAGDRSASRTPPTAERNGAPSCEGRRFVLGGRVQGLGVRPTFFHLATELGLGGTVRNTQRGVEIELEGARDALDRFERRLPGALPAGACVSRLHVETFVPIGRKQFMIVKEPAHGPLAARVPEDRAVCSTCAQEIDEISDRRLRYPFTSCTLCGPRYTVIREMPFERDETVMAEFPLCPDCRREYTQPGDRRFHAQTTACPRCGPRVWYSDGADGRQLLGEGAIVAAVRQLVAGKIVAIRGLGGYQLLVDATNQPAVTRLRDRKGRRAKPLAVMVESVEAAERLAYLDSDERAALADWSAPIVLVRARTTGGLAAAIHPHLDTVGLMRPTTPLHAILVRDFGRPLVCTSGNREGDPLEYEVEAAERRLAGIADAWLHHDREITRPIDDSVVRVIAGRRVAIRLARGLAPLSLDLPPSSPRLAVGGFLKAAVAWSNGAQAVLGPHIGDQEALPARQRFVEHLQDWQQLYRFRPAELIHDMHPEYFSTQWAQGQGLPTTAVQHHHAHVMAGMLEHQWLDRPVLGVSWDGTGYGTDGTIWGGEFLACTAASLERVARLRPFRLPGGEAAVYEPWRTAVSVCRQLDEPFDRAAWSSWDIGPERIASLRRIADRPQLSPTTTSAGRLFDAVAALTLGITESDFEGQAAMRLEAVADRTTPGDYDFPLRNSTPAELDWRPLVSGLLADRRRGAGPAAIAMRFHRSLARGIVRVCCSRPDLPVVLGGGVFQNRLLTELVAEMWRDESQPLGLPGAIPPNDGGLAAGQLAVAAAKGQL